MKTIDEIYKDMLRGFEAETGYAMGDSADLAVRLKAAASEIFGLYVYADWVGRMTFPQTAEGKYLDYHAAIRGLTRRSADKAQGQLRFYISKALSYEVDIPLGTLCSTAGMVDFVTTEGAKISPGSLYVDVPAQAAAAGTSGNVRAGTVVVLPLPPVSVGGCTNPTAFTGGADGEGDEALRARVLDTFKRPPNGANSAYYENLVLEEPDVLSANIIPRYKGIGTVGVVVTAEEGADETELVQRLEKKLSRLREIAVDVTVMLPKQVITDVSISVLEGEGLEYDTVSAAVRQAIEAHFDGSLLAKPLLLRDLYDILGKLDGVANYSVSLPAGDVDIAADEIGVLGNLSISRMEE